MKSRSPAHLNRFRPVATLVFPIPFLIGVALVATALWQNDADFVLGNVVAVDAVLVESGPPHTVRGRPRYYPSFRLPDGRSLTLENAMLASELPAPGIAARLRCSTHQPRVCKMPVTPNVDPVFAGIAALWTLLSFGIAWAIWVPYVRKAWARLQTA